MVVPRLVFDSITRGWKSWQSGVLLITGVMEQKARQPVRKRLLRSSGPMACRGKSTLRDQLVQLSFLDGDTKTQREEENS